jgi:predicted house-cleaning noncanonical NTP pyrophosphatase (MazG superfamily)
MASMNNERALRRLVDRLEEFVEEFQNDMEADEVAAVQDVIALVDMFADRLVDGSEDEVDGDSSSLFDGKLDN